MYVAGECYRLDAAATLSVPTMPVGLDRRDLQIGLAADHQAQHLLLAEGFAEPGAGAVTTLLRVSRG